MSPRRPVSLQRRLILSVTGAVALLWLLTAWVTYRETHHELEELLDAHLAQVAGLLVSQAGHGEVDAHDLDAAEADARDDDSDSDDTRRDTPSLHRHAQRVAFQVWQNGQLRMRSPTAPLTPLTDLHHGFETLSLDGEPWRLFATQGRGRGVQVYVAERMSSRADILQGMLIGLMSPLALALPLIALAVWWAVRRGLRPLGQLGQTLAGRQPGDLSAVALPGAAPPAELLPVLQNLNDLLARIGALLDSERRFTADAAHELRTPIAAIRAQAQVALAASEDAERRHALQATLQGCDRASHLVQQLLTLSRLEAADATAPTTAPPPVDLAALARAVVGELAPEAVARQQTLSLDAPAQLLLSLPLPGHDTLLRVLLRNLVDNALRYSPEGAQVQVGRSAPLGGLGVRVRWPAEHKHGA
jgi:two-component system sensor histidine kinase QseC